MKEVIVPTAIRWSLLTALSLTVACAFGRGGVPGAPGDAAQVVPDATDGNPPTGSAEGGLDDAATPPGQDAATGEPVLCGDGVVSGDETCDDGNGRPADGCSGTCQREPGYACEMPGVPCVRNTECGNGLIEPGEACDDGNNDLGDGCADCRVEFGWTCDADGCSQVVVSECGDGKVGGFEQCDDGQDPPTANDGCDESCRVEPGFRCPNPGELCQPLVLDFCGDRKVREPETCDDGGRQPGDGCDASCQEELGFTCTEAGCAVTCGDGLVVGQEACDDGNSAGGDGCAADCGRVESGYVCPVAGGVGGACQKQAPDSVCPNATLEFGEACDDGNSTDADGCTKCQLDEGYRCPVPGESCEPQPTCGDGFVDFALDEQCDDQNQADGDGCSAACEVEGGFVCPSPKLDGQRWQGGACREVVCGDGQREQGEQCDDGGQANGDGCSETCRLEPGWACPPDGSCLAEECGDGRRAGAEECDYDDANGTGARVDGVACDANCRIDYEPYLCGHGGQGPSVGCCGDGRLDPGEACDDGNHDQGDGCGVFCTREPRCAPPAPCESECGDGIRFGGEGCDDGNTRDGDGCSSSCDVEPGFTCLEQAGESLALPIVYRDFQDFEQGGHVAFQWSDNDPISRTRPEDIWVRTRLGTANDFTPDGGSLVGKPVFYAFVACDDRGCTRVHGAEPPAGTRGRGACYREGGELRRMKQDGRNVYFCGYGAQDFVTFSQWYRDVPGVNIPIVSTLTLDRDGGSYAFSDSEFFPIDDQGFGNYGRSGRNFHFTSDVRYWFKYDASQRAKLTFNGDDDVWVFVNGKLVVDISGTHGAITDSVTLRGNTTDIVGNRLNLQDGEVYEIVVFQAERNTSGSSYRLTLQDFNMAPSRCFSVCGDGVQASDEECDLGAPCADGSECDGGQCGDGTSCNSDAHGGCTAECKLGPYCGDGKPDKDQEQCDDGVNDDLYASAAQSGCAPGCVYAPHCGDGELAVGVEICDGGEECDSDCTPKASCGDGKLDRGEQCDTGSDNGTPQSACDIACRDTCGNGSVDAGEQCDPGQGGFSNTYGGCLPEVGDQRGCLRGPHCGDGVPNGSEPCDDGRNDGSYGTCAPGCELGPRCGDGNPQPTAGEVCDTGMWNVTDSYQVQGEGACTTACRPVRYCGDGAVTDGEGCDDGVNSGEPGSCTPDCKSWVPLATCGNGQQDAGEQCDEGIQNGTSQSACDARCRLRCGNGLRDEGETCDDGVNDGRYGTCTPSCQLAEHCGDGETQGAEQCDAGEQNLSEPYGEGLCAATCRLAPYCGDGRIQVAHGEECDGQSGCTAECRWVEFI